MFDLSKIHEKHLYFRQELEYFDYAHGSLVILTCTSCPYREVWCEHTQNSWNDEQTQLTCDLCGEDGT